MAAVMHRIRFATKDGLELSLTRFAVARGSTPSTSMLAPAPTPRLGPVLLVHGAGVRSNIFSPPNETTLPAMLAAAGYDVWALDWRGSIEVRPNEWTLDDAAVHDYPAAIRIIREQTGAVTIKAVVHCQGSTSFMMSIVAGLLPEVDTVIANAVALHTIVPPLAQLKSAVATPTIGRMITYVNPQWGLHATGLWPRLIDFYVRALHHECRNPVCKHASFTYGSGMPTLWRHENLSDTTHEWIKSEFGHVPMSFFRQMSRCIAQGNLVSTGRYDEALPRDFCAQAPRTDARFVFLGGQYNDCFRSRSMAATLDFFDRWAPGRHGYQELAGYGHLDVFIGRDAHRDVFPMILDELERA